MSVQNSVTGSVAGVHVPSGASSPAALRLFSMMQKFAVAESAHSAGRWIRTVGVSALVGRALKSVSTVIEVAVLATTARRSSWR